MRDYRTHHVHFSVVRQSALNVIRHFSDVSGVVKNEKFQNSEESSEDLERKITDLRHFL